jgi:hypothetical protein
METDPSVPPSGEPAAASGAGPAPVRAPSTEALARLEEELAALETELAALEADDGSDG